MHFSLIQSNEWKKLAIYYNLERNTLQVPKDQYWM